MAKIITFGNQKGGTGKTTCTVIAANALSNKPFNFDLTVLDCDPQQSIIESRKMDLIGNESILPYRVESSNLATFQKNAAKYDKENDFLFLDVAGALDINLPFESQEITKYLQYVDFLFIPFLRGNYTLESSIKYLKFALEVQRSRAKTKRPLQIVGFVNKVRTGGRNDAFLNSEIESLKTLVNIPFMENPLKDYVLYEDTDTIESYYKPSSKSKDYLNFKKWFSEFNKIVTSK